MAYLNLGTGIAAGFVKGGRLWRGARGTASRVGIRGIRDAYRRRSAWLRIPGPEASVGVRISAVVQGVAQRAAAARRGKVRA